MCNACYRCSHKKVKVNVQSAWSQFSQLEELFHFMLLAAYVDARPLFYATEIFCSLQLLTWYCKLLLVISMHTNRKFEVFQGLHFLLILICKK